MHLCTFLDWKERFSLYSRHPSAWFHHLGEKEGPTCGAVEEAGMEGLSIGVRIAVNTQS